MALAIFAFGFGCVGTVAVFFAFGFGYAFAVNVALLAVLAVAIGLTFHSGCCLALACCWVAKPTTPAIAVGGALDVGAFALDAVLRFV